MSAEIDKLVAELRELANWLEADPAFNPAANVAYVSALRNAATALTSARQEIAKAHLHAEDVVAEAARLAERTEDLETRIIGLEAMLCDGEKEVADTETAFTAERERLGGIVEAQRQRIGELEAELEEWRNAKLTDVPL